MGTMGTMAVLALLLACSVAGESSRMVEETTYDGEYERWTSRPPTPMPEPSEAQELEQLCEVSSMQRAASSRAGSGHAPAANPARDPRCELYLATRHPAHQGGHTSQGGQSHTGQGKEGHQGSQPNPNQGNLPSYKHVQDLLLADRQGRQGWTRHPDTGEDVCERWNPDRRNQQLCAALPCCHFNLNPLDPGFGLCWSDVGAGLCSAPECPVEEPELGSPCAHPAGEQCSYGQECCCGECHPSKRMQCAEGRWRGHFTDACFHPNCPTTGGSSTAAYCALDPGHTMCLHSGPSSECAAKTILRGMTQEGKDAILAKHNDLRRRVARGEESGQPAAGDMRELVWDSELEEIAQRWADQCTFAHDPIHGKLDGTAVGQNLYIGGSSVQTDQAGLTSTAPVPAQAWYDEVTDPGFSSGDIDPFVFSYGAGHYTQVVWASTSSVGCANVYYFDGSFYQNLVVCNYAVAGNLQGGTMYTQGTACTSCPSGTSCVASLCRAD